MEFKKVMSRYCLPWTHTEVFMMSKYLLFLKIFAVSFCLNHFMAVVASGVC